MVVFLHKEVGDIRGGGYIPRLLGIQVTKQNCNGLSQNVAEANFPSQMVITFLRQVASVHGTI